MDKAKNISLKKLLTGSLGTVLGLVILVVVFTALSNIFLTPSNIRNILIQSGTNAIIAVGMTYVIIPETLIFPWARPWHCPPVWVLPLWWEPAMWDWVWRLCC